MTFERAKGHCKHGEYFLSEGCPLCEAEWKEATEGKQEGEIETTEVKLPAAETPPVAQVASLFGPRQIVKVKYHSETTGEVSDKEYCYFSEEPLTVGQLIQVPVRDRIQKAIVTAVNVPESEIAAFREKVKTIPAGSIFPGKVETTEAAQEEGPYPQGLNDGEVNEEGASETEAYRETLAAIPEPKEPKEAFDEGEMTPEERASLTPGPNVGPIPTALLKLEEANQLVEPGLLQAAQEAERLREFAAARIISTNEDLKPATDDLAVIARVKKAVQAKKDEILQPFKAQVAEISQAFDELLRPLNEADTINRNKIAEFRRIEQDKLALAQREAAAKGGEFTTELQKPVPERTRTAMGTQGFQKVYKWEVTDKAAVPDQYKIIDAGKVTGVVRGSKGTIEIPGIRIWTDETVRINTR